MERKNKQQPLSDPKKQQDAALSSRAWPRGSKLPNKQPQQRSKPTDRRPKPREPHHGSLGGKADSRLGVDAEPGSLFIPGNKKQNLNHLLNFHYESRDVTQNRGRGNRKPRGLISTSTHKHNKELFLQSNCQFVVKASGDYSQYLVDPDIPVKWDAIEQINIRMNEALSCPICLGEIVAGRITQCGHAYCWPCLLHYFALSDNSCRPCPVCFQPIDKIHLKSVQGIWQNHIPVGENITMRLMRRMRGTIAIELAPLLENTDTMDVDKKRLLSVSEHEISSLFSKLLTATPFEVSDIIARERHELNHQLSPELEHPEFVLQALNLLQAREDKLLQNCSNEASVEIESSADKIEPNTDGDKVDEANSNSESLSQDKYFYFYQAADGQPIFMHAVNIHTIENSWGSLKQAPRELHGKILERESGSVEAESRRRLRYLQHLPIRCPYDVVEIALEPPFVTREAIDLFKDELDNRKRKRQKRARHEKHREKIISQKEQIIMGRTPAMEININSEEHFPVYQPGLENSPSVSECRHDESDSSSVASSLPKHDSLSFAKMASKSGAWTIRPSTSRNPVEEDEISDNEGVPSTYNLCDAISAALQKTSVSVDVVQAKGGKKKKQKQKVLFTTFVKNHNAID